MNKSETEQLKVENAIRRRYYAVGKLKLSDFQKLRKWLDRRDKVEIATDAHGRVFLLNQTKMQNCKTQNLFH